jgi:hypothetical protein
MLIKYLDLKIRLFATILSFRASAFVLFRICECKRMVKYMQNTGQINTHQFRSMLRVLTNACLLFCLVVAVIGSNNAMAWPKPPKFDDPTPGTPKLSAELTQTKIKLSWNATQHAEYYAVFTYSFGQSQGMKHVEDIRGTKATFDYQSREWDIENVRLLIRACKTPPWWVRLVRWELDRCSGYSNSARVKDQLIPNAPSLILSAGTDRISLSWNAVDFAKSYRIEIYNQSKWKSLTTIADTHYDLDYQSSWDLSDVQFRVKACHSSTRCSDYSNTVEPMAQLPQVNPSFLLASYAVSLPNLSNNLTDTAEPQPRLLLESSTQPLGTGRYIVATLRLTDRDSGDSQDIRWPIDLDTNNFTVTSNKTIVVKPGHYNVEFLATDGDVSYVAKALNVELSSAQQTIPLQLELKTVIGESNITIDDVIALPEFQFQYDPAELTNFTQPKIGVMIDGGDETLLTLNPATGITSQYLSISAGEHHIKLNFYDELLYKGRSKPEQENRIIIPGQPFAMDLIPLHGETTLSLTSSGEAMFNFAIPAVAIEEVGGNPDNLQVVLSVNGINNQPDDVQLSNLTYNADSNVYLAQYTYNDMQADSDMTLSLTFTDIGTEPTQQLGTCVADNIVLNSSPNTVSCQLTLRRRAIVGGHLLSVLGINVFDAANLPVSGASIYAKRLDTEAGDQDDDLGTLLGLTGSSTFGTNGYLKTYLVTDSYKLTAKYVSLDATAEATITLASFEVTNQDLFLGDAVHNNIPPNIVITAPAIDTTVLNNYTIKWSASDPDNQANISLYYSTDNSSYNGTLIVDNLIEGTDTHYNWDTSDLPKGDYTIYAKIEDGENSAVYSYGMGIVTISSLSQAKLNDTGIDWGGRYTSGNNSSCSGETIAQQDCSHGRDAQAAAGTLTKVGSGAAGFDFTKLDIDGNALPASATDHRCVRDNHTGLIWEVKTTDGGIHDKDHGYRWGGKTDQVTQQARDDGWGGFYNDWDTLIDGSNNGSLCGFNDWRVPTLKELMTITHKGTTSPSIDSHYFPNTKSHYYWSSLPYAYNSDSAWAVHFATGGDIIDSRALYNALRLVRSEQ